MQRPRAEEKNMRNANRGAAAIGYGARKTTARRALGSAGVTAGVLAIGAVLASAHCGGGGSSDNKSGNDGGPEPIVVPAPCAGSSEPKDHPECVVDRIGIFASPTGDDANPGTKAKPVRSIAAALQRVEPVTSRIYFCEWLYEGSLAHARNISYFGGFDCSTWSYNGKRAKIRSAAGSIALRISDVKNVAVADLDFEASTATGKGESSIAGSVVNSTVSLVRTTFTAQAGGDGESNPAEGGTFTPTRAPNGKDAQYRRTPQPAYQANDLCPDSRGGGGISTGLAQPGSPAMSTPHPDASSDGAAGADYGSDRCNPVARSGSNGSGGLPGQPATRYGTLDATGWHSEPGGAGGNGGLAQGGGGAGGSSLGPGAGFWWGASGGAGGCGGAGGSGGPGGGSSLALIAFGSQVTIKDSKFSAGAAGAGGAGGRGQVGQTGGAGGAGSDGYACAGGRGGTGGSGGGGAGGTGGLSVGILSTSSTLTIEGQPMQTAPIYDGITVAAAGGHGGTGGPGGPPAPEVTDELTRGATANLGKAGIASALLQLP